MATRWRGVANSLDRLRSGMAPLRCASEKPARLAACLALHSYLGYEVETQPAAWEGHQCSDVRVLIGSRGRVTELEKVFRRIDAVQAEAIRCRPDCPALHALNGGRGRKRVGLLRRIEVDSDLNPVAAMDMHATPVADMGLLKRKIGGELGLLIFDEDDQGTFVACEVDSLRFSAPEDIPHGAIAWHMEQGDFGDSLPLHKNLDFGHIRSFPPNGAFDEF